MFIRRNPNQQYRRVAKRAFRGKGVFPVREAVRGRRGVVSHHGAPEVGGAENAAFSTV